MTEPAFPIVRQPQLGEKFYNGMSLRDYFAAKAMQAIVSNHTMTENPGYDRNGAAIEAYLLADAMLLEREKKS